MTGHAESDTYIPYGRGGAGNMRRKSAIRDAWFRIISQPEAHPLTLTSSPEEHYASSKSEPRRRSTNSSTWSSSTAGGEHHRSAWKRWLSLRRRSTDEVVEEKEGKGEDSDDKTEDAEACER